MSSFASKGNFRNSKSAPPFWIIACSLRENQGTEAIYSAVKQGTLNPRHPLCDEVGIFDVPFNLKFGSFDDLIRSVDILQRQDAAVETILRRVERQALELDPRTHFKIIWQRHSLTVEQYIRRFTWDDAKFPRSRTIRENIEMLVQTVGKLDDEVRAKVAVWHEVSQQVTMSSAKQEVALYSQCDLIDILTPAVIRNEDFIETEHLKTLIVCIPRGLDLEWQKTYEKLCNTVVPRSSYRFPVPDDKEGNSLWRVVLFKDSVNNFKQSAIEKKFLVKDFLYNENYYKEVVELRSKVEAEKSKHEIFLSRVCFAAFSDIFIAWAHLKAMRAFCEAVLRFGIPPEFATFFLRPLPDGNEKRLREELDSIVTPKGRFGNKFYAYDAADIEDSEVFYPYVWMTLQPFGA